MKSILLIRKSKHAPKPKADKLQMFIQVHLCELLVVALFLGFARGILTVSGFTLRARACLVVLVVFPVISVRKGPVVKYS